MHLRALEVAQRPGNWGTVVDRWVIGQPKDVLRATGCKAGDRSVLATTDCVRVGRLLGQDGMVGRWIVGQPKERLGATGCKAGDRNVLTATDGLKVSRLLGWKPVADVRVTDFSQPDTLWDNGS